MLIACQVAIGFTSAVDGRVDRIVPNLAVTRPTFMCGAPRIFEKVRATVLASNARVKGGISRWAFTVGERAARVPQRASPCPGCSGCIQLADRLVFSKLQHHGWAAMKFMVSGSAKLNKKVQGWFYSAGLVIIEGYGLTETTAVAFVNLPTDPVFGTVGKALPGTEFKLADDGEVLGAGPV